MPGTSELTCAFAQLSNNGITGDKDFYDGLLDITHAADFITVSYTKFHDHVSHVLYILHARVT